MAVLGISIGTSFLVALVVGPMIAAQSGVRVLFWVAAGLALLAGALLGLLPKGIRKPERTGGRSVTAALRPDLLRLDLYIFLLHALLTASFVALPFVLRNQLGMLLTDHWKIYIGALLASLLGTIPLIVGDERQGKSSTVGVALGLLLLGQLLLAFGSHALATIFAALAIFFAGFNFLEAGLPARLSIRASGDIRGASLGVFSSAQFLGAFVGGLLGGQFLSAGNPASVFVVCSVICALWLSLHQLIENKD
jgi:predicted MFS family arabinose efflux permease